jgi:hypothetical protein
MHVVVSRQNCVGCQEEVGQKEQQAKTDTKAQGFDDGCSSIGVRDICIQLVIISNNSYVQTIIIRILYDIHTYQ